MSEGPSDGTFPETAPGALHPLHVYSSATPFLSNIPKTKYLWELSEFILFYFFTFYSPVNYCSQVFDCITLLKLLLKSIQTSSILLNPMVNN